MNLATILLAACLLAAAVCAEPPPAPAASPPPPAGRRRHAMLPSLRLKPRVGREDEKRAAAAGAPGAGGRAAAVVSRRPVIVRPAHLTRPRPVERRAAAAGAARRRVMKPAPVLLASERGRGVGALATHRRPDGINNAPAPQTAAAAGVLQAGNGQEGMPAGLGHRN